MSKIIINTELSPIPNQSVLVILLLIKLNLKTMKSNTLSILIALLFSSIIGNSNAQDTTIVVSGVFLTAKDYQNNKLIQEADCENDEQKFKTYNFFSKSTFDILYKGKKTTYEKKDIYAYRNCHNEVWRFYKNKEYQIKETKAMYIYSVNKVVVDGGVIEMEPIYYFSTAADEEIKLLTIHNLKKEYPNNKTYHNMLDAEFSSDKAIQSYDFTNKMYFVNYLLIKSKK
jgi:hypothetical protein